MLMQKPTDEMIKEWKYIYDKNKDKIIPNKKDGLDIIKYLKDNYSVIEIQKKELENIVSDNVTLNEYLNNKLNGKRPIIKVFEVNDEHLYLKQDEVFKGTKIIVGIELNISYIFVEGSSYLYDELIAFTGLDYEDTNNYFLVAQYIKCKEKFDRIRVKSSQK